MKSALRAVSSAAACGLLVVAAAVDAAPSGYLCAAEVTTGFAFDSTTKQWREGSFRSTTKLLLSRVTGKSYAWEVKEIGSSSPSLFCKEDFSEHGLMHCSGIGRELKINRKLLRFLYLYSIGYWDEGSWELISPGRKEGSDTPAMAIGKCSPS